MGRLLTGFLIGILGELGHLFMVALRYQNVELALSTKFAFKSLAFHFKREAWHHCFHVVSHTSLGFLVFLKR